MKNWIIKNTQTADQEGVHLRWDDVFKKIGKNEKAPDDFLRESLRSRGADDGNNKYVFDSYELPNYSSRVKASKNLLYTIIKNIVKEIEINDRILRQLLFLFNLELWTQIFIENDNLSNPNLELNKFC